MNVDPPFGDAGIPDGERTTYRGTISGEDVGTSELRIAFLKGLTL